jgi:hypothetical protein
MNEGMAAVEAKVFLTRPASVLIAFGSEGTSDIPIGGARKSGARSSDGWHAGLETRDTAGSEACGTSTGQRDSSFTGAVSVCAPSQGEGPPLTLQNQPGDLGLSNNRSHVRTADAFQDEPPDT